MKDTTLTLFRAPGGVIRALPYQAECPVGHLVGDIKWIITKDLSLQKVQIISSAMRLSWNAV